MTTERCPKCGFRLDIDYSPCVLCQTGWGMTTADSKGVQTTRSCHDTCTALREWLTRRATIKVEDGERA